jgi:AmmeMemoRadiSam system protein B
MDRPMILAMNGWYPGSKEKCKSEIEKLIDWDVFIEGRKPVGAIVPHAGWFFCGHWSVNGIRLLKEKNGDINHVVIFGGHLGPSNLPIVETFDFAETPFGRLRNDKSVIDMLQRELNVQSMKYLQDNTIEVLLPIVHYFFGDIPVSCIYLPANERSARAAELIHKHLGPGAVYIGSTDLTHYGPNYGFFHNDKTVPAIDWVTGTNDRQYIDLLVSMKLEESLKYALDNKSACSSGAALGVMAVARNTGVNSGVLLGYGTSYEKHKDTSFVGYTGILY